jgi:NADH-quinone oxidoreductase subunit M
MSVLGFPWFTVLLGLPLAFAVGARAKIGPTIVRRAAIAAGVLMLAATIPPLVEVASGATVVDPLDPAALFGAEPLFLVDTLSAPLLPFTIAVWLLVLTLSPRQARAPAMVRRSALGAAGALAVFLTRNEALLALLWMGSTLVLLADIRASGHERVFRVALVYLGASAVLFTAGVVLLAFDQVGWGTGAIAVAVLVRKGIVPLHAWIPELFENGPFGSAVLFSIPQMGAYVAAIVLLPRASDAVLTTIVVLSLVTGVFGAALALVQTDARRAVGYLFVSQSAFVMTGIESPSIEGITAGLSLWLSSGAAFAGLAMTVWVIELRRGRLPLTSYHGGYDQSPILASTFLVLGLACSGFPGTLGFIGGELLLEAAVTRFPYAGFLVVLATALSGITILRMYFSLFCGKAGVSIPAPFRRRKHVLFAALVVVLFAGGLAPKPIVDSRATAARALLAARASAEH